MRRYIRREDPLSEYLCNCARTSADFHFNLETKVLKYNSNKILVFKFYNSRITDDQMEVNFKASLIFKKDRNRVQDAVDC